MTMETSPRATRAAPARARPRDATPARRAAHQPVPTFVAVVTSASTTAHSSTSGMAPGSVCRPNTTKNTAANRSRSGSSSFVAFSAVGPEMAMPSRNAPTAAETCIAEAMPATSSAEPRILSRNTSRSALSTTVETYLPYRSATSRTTLTTASETPTALSPPSRLTPASRAVRIGRYSAITRSSNTRTDSTTGVSRLPSLPRSPRTLAMMPEEEM